MNKISGINFTIISINDYLAFGPRYIHAFLHSNGLNANIIFFKNLLTSRRCAGSKERDEALLLNLLRELKTDLVGVSVCSPYLKIATDVTLRIQRELKIPVLWGGVHPTIMPEHSLQIADMICMGEGELPTLELIRKLVHSGDIRDVQGILTKADKHTIRAPLRPVTQDLDIFSFPEYGDSGKYFIESGNTYAGDPASYNGKRCDKAGSWRKGYISCKDEYYALASRGCPYNCTYCCNSIAYGRQYRVRSVAGVIDEIVSAKNTFPDIRRIQFYDAIFPWDKKWVRDFCLEYKKKINLPFYVISYFDVVDEENIGFMKWAGLDSMCFGIESGSERIRREIYNKDISNDTILKVASLLHRKKISPYYCFIVDNPFEQEEEKQEALSLLSRLPRPFIVNMHALYLFPKAKITDEVLLRFGKQPGFDKDDSLGSQPAETLDFINKPIEDIFWQSILSLSAKSFLPRPVIKFMFNCRVFRDYPMAVYLLARVFTYLKFISIGMAKFVRGQITLKNIKNNVSLRQFTRLYN